MSLIELVQFVPLVNTVMLLCLFIGVPIYLRRHAELDTRIKGQQERIEFLERQRLESDARQVQQEERASARLRERESEWE